MKKNIIIITALVLSMVNGLPALEGQWSMVKADDFVPAEEAVPENSSPSYVLDSNDSGGDITIQFGTALNESLKWNSASSRFDLSDDLNIAGGIFTTDGAAIGNNTGVISIDSTDWDVSITGIMTGISGFTNDAALTTSGGAVSVNNNSNFATDINTGSSTGTVTIGGTGTQTIAVGNGGGVKTVNLGSSNTTSTTTLLSGSGGLNANVANNQPTNINTGASTGTVTLGNNGGNVVVNSSVWDITGAGVASGLTGLTTTGTVSLGNSTGTVTIDSSDWDISSTGAMTGIGAITMDGLLTGTLGATLSGATINLNDSSNFAVNIGTGSSTGTVTLGGTGTQTIAVGNGAGVKTVNLGSSNTTSTTTILSGSGGLNANVNNNQPTNVGTGSSNGAVSVGGGSNTVAVNSTSWDISTAGVGSGFTGFTSTGTVDFSGATRLAMQSAGANPGTCTEGDLFYNTATNFTYVCTATNTWNSIQPDTATFTDTTPGNLADNDSTEMFNDATRPNITTDSTGSTVLVSFMVRGTSADNDAESDAFRVIRSTDGSNPVCGTDPQVGEVVTGNTTDTGIVWTATGTFLDSPGVAGQIRYTVCSSALSNTGGDLDTAENAVNVVLTELEG